MTQTKTIKRLTTISNDPSKQEEKEWLIEVAASVPQSSYLASLFTSELVRFAINQINSDFAPDIHAHLLVARSDANNFYTDKQETLTEVARLKEQIERAKKLNGEMLVVVEAEQAEKEEWRQKFYDEQNRYNELEEESRAVQTDMGYALEKATQTILELKAKLYDKAGG